MTVKLRGIKLVLSVLYLSFIPLGLFADETEQKGADHSFEHHGRHNLGLFVGITREHEHNRETIGIEYSYRINRYWSAGAVVERAERDQDSTLASVTSGDWDHRRCPCRSIGCTGFW